MAQKQNNTFPSPGREVLINQPDFLQEIAQTTLQHLLEEEIAVHLKAVPFERTNARRRCRNRYRSLQLNPIASTVLIDSHGLRRNL